MKFLPDTPQVMIRDHLLVHLAALLFVGMGLGKTAAVLAAICEMLQEGMIRGVLVVAPLRVCNLTWPMEVLNWDEFNWLKVANLRTEEGREAYRRGSAHIYLINYEALGARDVTRTVPCPLREHHIALLRQGIPHDHPLHTQSKLLTHADWNLLADGGMPEVVKTFTATEEETNHYPGIVESLFTTTVETPFDTIVFDESTKGKNHRVKGLIELRKFLAKSPTVTRRIAMTGTPAPNSVSDVFGQVLLVDRGKRLGTKFDPFQEEYFQPTGYHGYKWVPQAGAEERIYAKIADITLTLRTRDWLDLPDTVIEDIDVTLPKELMTQYIEFERDLVMQLDTGEITAPTAAALVTKLLQFTSGQVYDGDRLVHDLHDLKTKALTKLVKDRPGEPLLVACVYKHEQARVREAFPQAEFFSDATTQGKQMALIERWNAGKIPMLVAHPASIGHGLNLQKGGNTLVWFTLTYSRELYEQMICRLMRRGQDKLVTVYRLICPGTVDEVVAEALTMKAGGEERMLTALLKLESLRDRR